MMDDAFFNQVFRYNPIEFSSECYFNMQILKVLYEINGKSTLFEIINKLNMELEFFKNIIDYLSKLKLVIPAIEDDFTISQDFFDFLLAAFSKVAGPVADLIIKEAIADMGFSRVSFPKDSVYELVQKLIIECDNSPEKEFFIKDVLDKIRMEYA